MRCLALLWGKGLIRALNSQVQAVEASWPKRDKLPEN